MEIFGQEWEKKKKLARKKMEKKNMERNKKKRTDNELEERDRNYCKRECERWKRERERDWIKCHVYWTGIYWYHKKLKEDNFIENQWH